MLNILFAFYYLFVVFGLVETEFVVVRPLMFTRRVLGRFASARLEEKKVTQTIRSDKEIEEIKVGDVVDVSLDYVPIGKARITSIDKVRLSDLGREDAERGGFEGIIDELRKALMRAGFRFKPLSEYVQNRVQFVWQSESDKKFHVRYINLVNGRTEEKTILEREQFDLYKEQREGKISIIEIKPI
jgi:hypothetical protein